MYICSCSERIPSNIRKLKTVLMNGQAASFKVSTSVTNCTTTIFKITLVTLRSGKHIVKLDLFSLISNSVCMIKPGKPPHTSEFPSLPVAHSLACIESIRAQQYWSKLCCFTEDDFQAIVQDAEEDSEDLDMAEI